MRSTTSALSYIDFPYQPGFNGGSALAANLRAAQACVVTNLAASVGGLTWMLWVSSGPFLQPFFELSLIITHSQDYRIERKWSAVGFCSGSIAGLVAITPASGFVGSRMFGIFVSGLPSLTSLLIAAAVLFGVMAGTVCNFATQLKFIAGYDDSLDVGPHLLVKVLI
jgi:Amt family ammonium transporter